MPILLPEDMNVKLPEMIKVRQNFEKENIEDVAARVSEILKEDKFSSLIHPDRKLLLL